MESSKIFQRYCIRRKFFFDSLRWTLVLVASLAFSGPAHSQEFQFKNFTELNGLPSSEAYHAIQDKAGFIWFGTDNGVARYDGEEFVIYNRTTGLTDNTVFGLFEDSDSRIWFRTFSGAISFYEKGTVYPYEYNSVIQPVLRSSIFNKIVVSGNRLWFSTTGQGPAGYVDSLGNVTLLENQIGPDKPAYLYAYSIDGMEYLTGFTGTPKYTTNIVIDGRQFSVKIDPNFLNNPVAQCMTIGPHVYVAVNRDLFRYDGVRLENIKTFDRPIINLSTDRQRNLWIGFFGGGVRKYSDHRFDLFESIKELERNSVSSTLQDSEGGYWFTTLDRGVFYFPNISIQTDAYTESQKISAVVRTRDALYTGNYAGEVTRLSPDLQDSKVVFESDFPIGALFEDKQGNLWWSSPQGYFIKSPSGLVERRSGLNAIRGFFFSPKGEVCAYNSSSVYIFDKHYNTSSRIGLPRRPVRVLATDSVIYVGSLYGLDRHDKNYLPLDMTPYFEGRISALQIAGPNLVLAGTIGNGLMLIDNKGKRLLNSHNGFNAENVYSILVESGSVWIGTDKGVLVAPLEGLREGFPVWKRLTRSSGLLSDKCNFLAMAEGKVLVFSDQGTSVVPASNSTFLNEKPVAYIKSILVNNEAHNPEVGQLEYTKNNISIDIGAISFNNRSLLHRHRLNKAAAWNYATGSNISYFNLNPGYYNIEVSASSDNINWYGGDQVIAIQIQVPWWRSWTFIAIILVAIVLTSWMIWMMRVNAIKRKQEYLELINNHQQKLIDSEIRTMERERKRIATDLHDGVGTALSSIKLLLSDSVMAKDGERDKRVNEINENLTDVIAEIKRIVYDLRPPALERYGLQVGLKNLTEKINNHGGISVMYDYYGQRELSPQVSITVYRIVQELINNTIRHAKATEIRIHVNQFDDEMNLMYEDNGIGMIGSRFSGLGLYTIESRVRSLSGRMSWESNHKGTFYNFDIPY